MRLEEAEERQRDMEEARLSRGDMMAEVFDVTPHSPAALLEDLAAAERANQHARPCQVCQALSSMSPDARAAVGRALVGGTIGERTLAEILTRNGYPTGRRAVATHRREAH